MNPEVVDIESIVAGGDGLARRHERPVVFVPRTAPGERVEVEYVEERRQWARARALRIIEPSPERRLPPCRHYDACGGCQLQHLRYDAQLRAKAGIVADALRRLGGLDVAPPEVVPSSSELEYRNRVTFTLKRTRGGVVAGLHAVEDPRRVIDLDRCPLAEPPIDRAWTTLRASWGSDAERLPPGRELRLTLRASQDGAVGLAIEGGTEGRGDPELLLERVDGLAAIWYLGPGGVVDWQVGPSALPDRWGAHDLLLSGSAFVQVNRAMAAKLEAYVQQQCGEVAELRAVDAYCGFGLRAIELAVAGAQVSAIDSDHHAIAVGRGAAVESAAQLRFIAGAVEDALPQEMPADLVLLNPPRRGVAGVVIDALLGEPPARIIYQSCDPATLARDLSRLAESFELQGCQAFDMFPQTAHVETVVTLAQRPRRKV
ncbi:MAG: class I SAM-dependent RNA methyltransferase [Gemmatimonadota bacterium]|nr:MAG: class I SAM-dependent RNA methyltransferase [Gemmatimonadota bacterium]